MKLTRQEQEMLEGRHGYPVQKAMEILVGIGECFDAEKMLPVGSVHLAGSNIITAGRGGAAFTREMADKGGRFAVTATTNITAHDSVLWREIGIPEDFFREDMAHLKSFERMGALTCNSCTPYLIGHVPRLGEHIAWGESSAINFVNSVLGARTNREGGPGGLASALTGRTPAYGYHLPQNRRGDIKIVVTAPLETTTDYGSLGYFAGKKAGQKVPVFTGMPASTDWDCLKMISAAAACSGGVALYHAVGITPEAPDETAAFQGKLPGASDTYEFGVKELKAIRETLSARKDDRVDLAVIGCPNASITEIREVASLLEGRKLKAELWIMTSRIIEQYAEIMGYAQAIRNAGGKMVCEVCTADLPRGLLLGRGFRGTATNSAKMVFFLASTQDMVSLYGSAKQCVEAAVTGVWR